MQPHQRLELAFTTFDAYNANDPNINFDEGVNYPKELLYAKRMTVRLNTYNPDAPDYLQLAARCQHIGRWEIPRASYTMDKKGYFQWRNTLKAHHANLAEKILSSCNYDPDTIEKVKFLLEKKQLQTNADTQVLEDVLCMVFIEFYLEAFAAQHEDEKVIDILRKTLKKMSAKAIQEATKIKVSDQIKILIEHAIN